MLERLGLGQGQQPGSGGINRGKADAPLFYGDETDLKTNRIEGVEGTDLSRALPGEVLGVGETEHEDEQSPSVRQEGGTLSGRASGGDAVWRESLMPEEKAVLKRYFD